jgi:hypothetical protein
MIYYGLGFAICGNQTEENAVCTMSAAPETRGENFKWQNNAPPRRQRDASCTLFFLEDCALQPA